MKTSSPLTPGAAERLALVDRVLDAAYGTPEAELGNKPDPLDEAIYIVLSFQTDLARFRSTWSRLRAAFPTWDALERASVPKIAQILRAGGLHRQKAQTIRCLLAEVRNVAGSLSLDLVRRLDDEDAERLLVRLPGLSWKGARCIMLYSLGRDMLPIDSNAFRILKRTGVISQRAVYRRRTLHDAIQAAVPTERRRALHVNLVVHGQRTCLPRNPKCASCPLVANCPRRGISLTTRRHVRAILAVSLGTHAKVQAVTAPP